jgi:hypothetical protein
MSKHTEYLVANRQMLSWHGGELNCAHCGRPIILDSKVVVQRNLQTRPKVRHQKCYERMLL